MIAALSLGAKALGESDYAQAAAEAADFILNRLRQPDGRLLHRYRQGEAHITAHLDDYAFLAWGLIELYEATFEPRHLKTALALNEDMLAHYWDDGAGGFFFTPDDGEALILRKKETVDGAVPSGNAVAMLNLLRLARFTAQPKLEDRASKIGQAFSGEIGQMPSAYTMFLVSADFAIGPSHEVVIVGFPDQEETRRMVRAVQDRFLPNHVLLFRPAGEGTAEIDKIAEFVHNHKSMDEKPTAYVCLGNTCTEPTTSIDEMLDRMGASR
jgi:hypothetical protein